MSISLGSLNQYPELYKQYLNLQQGDKIRFKWYGNSQLLYEGRIEIDHYGNKYFCSEHNYNLSSDVLNGMKFYNELMPFEHLTYFELIYD